MYCKANAETMALYRNHADTHNMARVVWDIAQLIPFSGCARAKAEKCKEIVTEREMQSSS